MNKDRGSGREELISSVELVFAGCLTAAINIKSKEISAQVKEAIIRAEKQNQSIRDMAKTVGVTKSAKKTKVDDPRILFLMKKTPLQKVNTL